MAIDFYGAGQDIALSIGADLIGKSYYAVTMETSGKIALANSTAERCIGIMQVAPSGGDTDVADVRINGTSRGVVAAAVEEGAELSATTAGKLTTASAGHYIVAIALEPASTDGDMPLVAIVNYQKNA